MEIRYENSFAPFFKNKLDLYDIYHTLKHNIIYQIYAVFQCIIIH